MAEVSYLFATAPITTEDQWSAMTSGWQLDGVYGHPNGPPLKVTANGTANLTVNPGRASVRGYFYDNTAPKLLAVPANGATTGRIDLVVVRLDPAADQITAEIKPGAPSGQPAPPALTRVAGGVWEVPLAYVTVPAGASTVLAAGVREGRAFTGRTVAPALSTAMPPDPFPGQIIYQQDTGAWVGWHAGGWRTLAHDSGWIELPINLPTLWEAAGINHGRTHNGIASLDLNLRRRGSTLTTRDPDGSRLSTVPAALRPGRYKHFAVRFQAGITARIEVRPDGQVWIVQPSADVAPGRVVRATLTYLP